ncbi:YdcF family protein [Jonesia denitrificans]|uniref:DUF218 domain-containing protein n=1 Tax=Jonesia denitrificans (strain ATCC 14870 / DSM 20603 / BCRC 15368 / CIP 55.134 / JCM 11481 / NBRC 15587 / NCTC 10816 / Prevot 55134) TaxID=471856 RepID=C7R5B6_JONDD|nr:YdcF family protein [Jonesia denitrificans]ACV07794.1 protein of unknown function DUF218 [Jonesia denitrificans DSM 20603]ASE08488.1 YdcF family protein [Jonesia denitrificans]QXB43096.1 YdcF family protein [Jonesia denitrificans]SQH19767.1 vancomycin high temperature exclusion protein [Jonesia denitrificans]
MDIVLTVLFVAAATHGFVTQPRRVRNMVYVGFAVMFAVLAVTAQGGNNTIVGVGIALFGVGFLLSIPVLAITFLAWGVSGFRRDVPRFAVVGILAGIALMCAPVVPFAMISQHSPGRIWASLWLVMIIGYLGFAFTCYLAYTFLYAAVPERFISSYIVVLGSELDGDQVTPVLASRLNYAITLYANYSAFHGETAIVVSGGTPEPPTDAPAQSPESAPVAPGPASVAEAHAMRDYLTNHGIPARDIVVEDTALTTEDNLIQSRLLIPEPDAPLAVVTSNYHVYRTTTLARQLGVRAHVYGAPTPRGFLAGSLLREFAAILTHTVLPNVLIIIGLTGLCLIGLRSTIGG